MIEGYINHHQRRPLGFLSLPSFPVAPLLPPPALFSGGRSSSKMVKGRDGQRVRLYVRGTILGYKR
jgi:hypothetical protein